MKQIILLAAVIIVLSTGCNSPVKNQAITIKYRTRVYQTEINQFGYDISKDNKLIIHQPIIPGIQGNKGFSTKENAQKVAELMAYKLDHNVMPPSVSLKELDSLKIQY